MGTENTALTASRLPKVAGLRCLPEQTRTHSRSPPAPVSA